MGGAAYSLLIHRGMDNEGFKRWMKREAFARIIFAIPKKPKWQAAEETGSTGTKESLYSTSSRLLSNVKVLVTEARSPARKAKNPARTCARVLIVPSALMFARLGYLMASLRSGRSSQSLYSLGSTPLRQQRTAATQ